MLHQSKLDPAGVGDEPRLERLLKSREVEKLTSMHRQTIWRKVRTGEFPAPRKLGSVNVWPESEIRNFINSIIGAP